MLAKILRYELGHWRQIQQRLLREFPGLWIACRPTDEDFYEKLHAFLCDPTRRSQFNVIAGNYGKKNRKLALPENIYSYYLYSLRGEPELLSQLPRRPRPVDVLNVFEGSDDLDGLANVAWALLEKNQIDHEVVQKLVSRRPELRIRLKDSLSDDITGQDDIDSRWQYTVGRLKEEVEKRHLLRPNVVLAEKIYSTAGQLLEIAKASAAVEAKKENFWRELIALLEGHEDIYSEHTHLAEIRNALKDERKRGVIPNDVESVLTKIRNSLALYDREKEVAVDLSTKFSSVSLKERIKLIKQMESATKGQEEAYNELERELQNLVHPEARDGSDTRFETARENSDVSVTATGKAPSSNLMTSPVMPVSDAASDHPDSVRHAHQEGHEVTPTEPSEENFVIEPVDRPSHEQKGTDTDPVPPTEGEVQDNGQIHSLSGKLDEEELDGNFKSVLMGTPSDLVPRLFDTLLREGKTALAYWLAYASEGLMDPNILGVLCEGGRIHPGGLCRGLLAQFLNELTNREMNWTDDERLLFSAAVLQPILFLQPHPPALYQLVTSPAVENTPLAEFVAYLRETCLYKKVTLGPEMLGRDPEEGEVETRLGDLSAKADNFLKHVPHIGFIYKPAEKALQFLYGPGTDLYRLHTLIAKDQRQCVVEITALHKRLDPRKIVSTLHQEPELSEIKRELTGGARNKLVRHLHDSLTLAAEWVGLVDKLKVEYVSEQGEHAANLKRELEKRLPEVQKALTDARQTPATISAKLQIAELERCLTVIGEGSQVPSIDQACIELPGIRLDDDMVPLDDDRPGLANAIYRLVTGGVPIEDICAVCLDRDEFARAELLIKRYGLGEAASKRLEKRRNERHRQLEESLFALQIKVEDAFLLGQLNEASSPPTADDLHTLARSTLLSLVDEGISKLKAGGPELNINIRTVANVARKIEEKVHKMVEDCRPRLDEEHARLIAMFPENKEGREDQAYLKSAFAKCMDHEDYVAAFDLLDRARYAVSKSEPVTRSSVGSSKNLEQFLKKADDYREYLGRSGGLRQLDNSIQSRDTVLGIPFGQLDRNRLSESVSALQAWNELSTRKEITSDKTATAVADVCRYIGFPVGLDGARPCGSALDGLAHFQLTILPSSSASPIPAFGSMLGSNLDVVVSQRRKEPEQITAFLEREGIQQKAVLVLLIYPESSSQRLKWQRECASSHLMALPLDSCLLMHLCGERNRLPALFDIALPFVWARPYITKGETVAREMFVGRQTEFDSLIDPTGGCIVFGGRQLGKSALLKHVHRESHDPRRGTFVAYLDVNDLGTEPQTHEEMERAFWPRISDQLVNAGAIPDLDKSAMRNIRSLEKTIGARYRAIEQALSADETKRIILLLDETDKLLDCDSKFDFKLVRRLRALMAETNRRFKVVFAGLQSVQRYKNWKNHPFAQLGAEMVINPLPPADAQELIIRPFRVLGFAFEDTRLIPRILSLTNYHPGLIQIFCYRLLEHLYTKWRRRETKTPIRPISSDDVLNVERDESFHEDIRNRFDWTLDLDDRYKVLTYALVLTPDPSTPRQESEFMELGKYWWPAVFENMDPQGLRAVLEEMVGLGVLVREREELTSRYRLRSPNLLRLLGPREAIDGELERIISLDRPNQPNPRNFHALIDQKSTQFGPLSKEQEGQIADMSHPFMLTLVLGSPAMGLRQVRAHVRKLMQDLTEADGMRTDDRDWYEGNIELGPEVVLTTDRVVQKLHNVFKPRNRKHCYVIIDFEEYVFEGDLGEFFEQITKDAMRLCTTRSRGKIVVLLGPEQVWNWVCSDTRRRTESNPRIATMTVRRWSDGAISNALDNIGLKTKSKEAGSDIFKLTAGVHALMSEVLTQAASLKGMDARKAVSIAEKVRNDLLESGDREKLLTDLGIVDNGSALQKAIRELLDLADEVEGIRCLTDASFNIPVEVLPQEDVARRLLEQQGSEIREWLRTLNLVWPAPTDAEIELCPWTAELFSEMR